MNKLFIGVLLGVFFSCKGTKTITHNETHNENSQKKEHSSDNIYRINISFISIGSGIDGKARQDFLNFISEYETKWNIHIEMETVKWGREGETDYCVKLSQLNSDEQAKFISSIKEIIKTSKLVRYSENTTCKKSN